MSSRRTQSSRAQQGRSHSQSEPEEEEQQLDFFVAGKGKSLVQKPPKATHEEARAEMVKTFRNTYSSDGDNDNEDGDDDDAGDNGHSAEVSDVSHPNLKRGKQVC